jgi:predicted metal-binding protein
MFDSWKGRYFSFCHCMLTQDPIQSIPKTLNLKIKQLECKADCSPPYIAAASKSHDAQYLKTKKMGSLV